MKHLRISWMVGMVCVALIATLALAGTQTSKQTERKGRVIEADKQTERKGRVIEADTRTGRKGKVIEADKQGPRGTKSIEDSSKKGNQNELLSRVNDVDNQEGPGVIIRDYRQSQKEQPTRVRAIPGQGPVISTNACPDPAARSIEFTILSRTTARSGRVRIEGVVRNIGREVYQSGPDMRSKAQLWQIGTGAPRLVAEKSFDSLLPELVNNRTSAMALASPVVQVQFERDWDSRSPNLGEFPPTYQLVIAYSGVGSAARPNDCNMSNNMKLRSGADLNSLFRQ